MSYDVDPTWDYDARWFEIDDQRWGAGNAAVEGVAWTWPDDPEDIGSWRVGDVTVTWPEVEPLVAQHNDWGTAFLEAGEAARERRGW